jgi:hypothetical protein
MSEYQEDLHNKWKTIESYLDREHQFRSKIESYCALDFLKRVEGQRGWFHLSGTDYYFLITHSKPPIWRKGTVKKRHTSLNVAFIDVLGSISEELQDKILLRPDLFY